MHWVQASSRRRLALALWRAPREGNIHARVQVDIGRSLAVVERARSRLSVPVSLTHLVVYAVAAGIQAVPELNRLAILGRIGQRRRVDVSVLVATAGDVGVATLRDVPALGLSGVAEQLRERAAQLRAAPASDRTLGLPAWALSRLIPVASGLAELTGRRVLGVQPSPMGACVVSQVGAFGAQTVFAPRTHYARTAFNVCVGAVYERVVSHRGELEVRPTVDLGFNFDHRLIDGAALRPGLRAMKAALAPSAVAAELGVPA